MVIKIIAVVLLVAVVLFVAVVAFVLCAIMTDEQDDGVKVDADQIMDYYNMMDNMNL